MSENDKEKHKRKVNFCDTTYDIKRKHFVTIQVNKSRFMYIHSRSILLAGWRQAGPCLQRVNPEGGNAAEYLSQMPLAVVRQLDRIIPGLWRFR
jgi:hypothetical protein